MLETCCGKMHWTPSEFWEASLYEIQASIDGFIEFHCAQPDDEPMSREQLDDLMAQYPD